VQFTGQQKNARDKHQQSYMYDHILLFGLRRWVALSPSASKRSFMLLSELTYIFWALHHCCASACAENMFALFSKVHAFAIKCSNNIRKLVCHLLFGSLVF
jgi:hypothetical protein